VYSHMDEYFFLQNLHVPQAMLKDTTTRSPTLRLVTSGPTRSMMPLASQRWVGLFHTDFTAVYHVSGGRVPNCSSASATRSGTFQSTSATHPRLRAIDNKWTAQLIIALTVSLT
jgi:hypothetical protein